MSNKIIAECPACMARYRVTPEQLSLANRHVRCGQCLTVFAVDSLPSKKTVQSDDTILSEDTAPREGLLTKVSQLTLEPPNLYSTEQSSNISFGLLAACLLALGLLATQYLWFERAHLANDPALSGIYKLACHHLDCTLSSSQGLATLNTTHLLVREISIPKNALELLTGLHNSGPLAVALPTLKIHFTDINGQIVAGRHLGPEDYQSESNVQTIQPNQRIELRLLIELPANRHLGYEVDWIARHGY